MVGEVSTLAHEPWDDAVEGAAIVSEALLASAEGAEVFSRLGHHVSKELDNNTSDGFAVSGDIEEDSGLGHFCKSRWTEKVFSEDTLQATRNRKKILSSMTPSEEGSFFQTVN